MGAIWRCRDRRRSGTAWCHDRGKGAKAHPCRRAREPISIDLSVAFDSTAALVPRVGTFAYLIWAVSIREEIIFLICVNKDIQQGMCKNIAFGRGACAPPDMPCTSRDPVHWQIYTRQIRFWPNYHKLICNVLTWNRSSSCCGSVWKPRTKRSSTFTS